MMNFTPMPYCVWKCPVVVPHKQRSRPDNERMILHTGYSLSIGDLKAHAPCDALPPTKDTPVPTKPDLLIVPLPPLYY